jgi:hypothetical protein
MCKPFQHPNIVPSWGCCRCHTINAKLRLTCRHCGHAVCTTDSPEPEERVFAQRQERPS